MPILIPIALNRWLACSALDAGPSSSPTRHTMLEVLFLWWTIRPGGRQRFDLLGVQNTVVNSSTQHFGESVLQSKHNIGIGWMCHGLWKADYSRIWYKLSWIRSLAFGHGSRRTHMLIVSRTTCIPGWKSSSNYSNPWFAETPSKSYNIHASSGQ